MNIGGKILTFFVVVGGTFAMIFSAALTGIQQKWWEKIEKNAAQLTALKTDVSKKKQERLGLEDNYFRTVRGWGLEWSECRAIADAQGVINVDTPMPGYTDKDATGNLTNASVHAFQPNGDGTYLYIGEFAPVQLVPNQRATFRPNWRVRPNEVANWKSGPGWRFRSNIPDAWRARFVGFETDFAIADELQQSRVRDIVVQDELILEAKTQLEFRLKEFNGLPELTPDIDKYPREYVVGLLNALAEEEEIRNQALAEIDALRHELYDAYQEFDQLRKDNTQLSAKINRKPSAETAKADSQE